MSRHHSHINTAANILNNYSGEMPFALFIKNYFSSNKKYGSRDRKQIAHLCYSFFRLGKSLGDISIEERILTGLFLCSTEPNEMLAAIKPEWNNSVQLDLENKLPILDFRFQISDLFPWKEELSMSIDHEGFFKSFLIQPDVFLRMRPGFERSVIEKFDSKGIDYKQVGKTSLSVPATTKLDEIIEFDKEAVIQDLNSQKTIELIKSEFRNPKSGMKTWDCCAGSGGKSILAFDLIPNIELIVSDARESIIQNLKKRFQRAGIKNYRSFIADLTGDRQPVTENFDLIICDAPCTGSGTWSRTPGQLYFFDEKKIDHYSLLQKKIISNSIAHLNVGGHFLYITCSVFKKENEENVAFMQKHFDVDLIKMELLKGYDKRADSLFVSLFEKRRK